MPLCDRAASGFGEATQSDTVILFPGDICALSQHTVPTRVPALVRVGSGQGRQ